MSNRHAWLMLESERWYGHPMGPEVRPRPCGVGHCSLQANTWVHWDPLVFARAYCGVHAHSFAAKYRIEIQSAAGRIRYLGY